LRGHEIIKLVSDASILQTEIGTTYISQHELYLVDWYLPAMIWAEAEAIQSYLKAYLDARLLPRMTRER